MWLYYISVTYKSRPIFTQSSKLTILPTNVSACLAVIKYKNIAVLSCMIISENLKHTLTHIHTHTFTHTHIHTHIHTHTHTHTYTYTHFEEVKAKANVCF